MKLLLDTHILLWTALGSDRIPKTMAARLTDPGVELVYSVVSLWEIVIKRALDRADFTADPRALRDDLLDNGFHELAVTAQHALGVAELPKLHGDPFDRMLVAQARAEGLTLITADRKVAAYADGIELV